MNKQVVVTISIGFFLAVIVFTGVFMFVMSSKQADSEPREQEIFYYDRAVKLYKNGSYIDAESALNELNARFPKSDSTRKANKDLEDVKKLAQQQKEASVEKIAQEEANRIEQQKQSDLKKIDELEKKLKERESSIYIGDDKEKVIKVLGQPERINKSVTRHGVREQFVYGKDYIYLEDGIVTSWQQSE